MTEIEEHVRKFVREGRVPVLEQPMMLERVAQGMRRRRQVKTAAVMVAGVAAIGGLVLAGRYAMPADNRDSSHVADGPTSNCSDVAVLAAATSTAAESSNSRGLAVLLTSTANASADAECVVGPGTRVELIGGQQTVSVEASDTIRAISLGADDKVGLQLKWANWCENTVPEVAVTFTDGSTTRLPLRDGTDTPRCSDSDLPSVLTLERLERADVQEGGTLPVS